MTRNGPSTPEMSKSHSPAISSSSEVAEGKQTELLKEITETVGPPKNYGLSEEDQNELDRRKEEERRLKLAAEAAEKKRRNEATLAEMASHYARWVSRGEEQKGTVRLNASKSGVGNLFD